MQSADKKPEKYVGPDGKTKIRMVPVDKEVVKNEGGMKRIATTQSNKADRMASGGKKGLETFKKREPQNEVSSKTLSNYMRKSAANAGKPRQDARTQDKRIGGQKMADDKLRKMDGKGSAAKVAATSVNELSKDTMQSYWDKTKGDDAFSGSRKANNRLKGAINVTTKLDKLKKMVKR